MTHTVDQLIEITYRHYARGMARSHPEYKRTAEHACLVAARRKAGVEDAPWRDLLRRLGKDFPQNQVHNGSHHLSTGDYDAAYLGKLFLPATAPGEDNRDIGFMVSFLVPSYVVYASHVFREPSQGPDPAASGSVAIAVDDTMFFLPPGVVKPEIAQHPLTLPRLRREVVFEMRPDEEPIASWLAREIEAIYGYERMPFDVGDMIVPDVATESRDLGEARLYDCLFTDQW